MGQCPISVSGTFCPACSDAGADRHIIKRALPDPTPTPTRELNISVNQHYPLLSITRPPLPFVRPADVMPPTAMEAGYDIARETNKLPVLASKTLSAPVTLAKGTHQQPEKIVIGRLVQSPSSKGTATSGAMGPPPHLVKKSKHRGVQKREGKNWR